MRWTGRAAWPAEFEHAGATAIIADSPANHRQVRSIPPSPRPSPASSCASPRSPPRRCSPRGCADDRHVHADAALVRRLQARHQPGQLPVPGHGGQAQGRPDARRRCGQLLGTPLVVSALPRQPLGLRLRVHAAGPRARAPQFTVYFVDDKLARWEGDEMPPSVAELNQRGRGRSPPARAPWSRPSAPGASSSSTSSRSDDGDADRHRRRRRADGPGADRGGARRLRLRARRRASTSPAAPRSGATPASGSAARTGVTVGADVDAARARRRRADRFHAAGGHARPSRRVRAARHRRRRGHDRASPRRRRRSSPRHARRSRSCSRRT